MATTSAAAQACHKMFAHELPLANPMPTAMINPITDPKIINAFITLAAVQQVVCHAVQTVKNPFIYAGFGEETAIQIRRGKTHPEFFARRSGS